MAHHQWWCTQVGIGPGLVVDNNIPAGFVSNTFGDEARGHVGQAARCKGHNVGNVGIRFEFRPGGRYHGCGHSRDTCRPGGIQT